MKFLRDRRGQLVIEYVLLLAVSVTAAVTITTALVNRNQNTSKQGFVIRIWSDILKKVGEDLPEDSP